MPLPPPPLSAPMRPPVLSSPLPSSEEVWEGCLAQAVCSPQGPLLYSPWLQGVALGEGEE